ncbi:hypothetical protein L226DRAFT_485461 [Lentinus tigrinus ALCF2SS1-7]|uniref:F-box domain-containing protein n=1 Tax=Lentinus tigrinus ALCF2SS1-6 TaxID=1328759 RepID=A0A5C2RQG5_9APHY|nr:hypothetical protein L227DRAFT_536342 [Lentinus tigrinus ALCF2SS1-6]RPD75362.1 hypothetical protein L226DRAFT_485461 [Lentinus tigrinus ALCF2SS1-7]
MFPHNRTDKVPLSLDSLGEDVLYLVALAVSNFPGALNAYSRTSHSIRSACLGMLFACARAPPAYLTVPANRDAPPLIIRPLVRQLTYYPAILEYADFGWELDFFPSLRSIKFVAIPRDYCSVPWMAIKTCIEHPNISSLSFLSCVPDMSGDGPLEATYRSILTDLSCVPYVWRDVSCRLDRRDVRNEHKLESDSLAALVASMTPLARHLRLPLETAPLGQMAIHPWLALRELYLSGRYITPENLKTLPDMLSDIPNRLPSLTSLTILASPLNGYGRTPILGRLSSQVHHPKLRSLTISYPDPDDAICALQAPNLTHLSLRDWPRYYYPLHFPDALTADIAWPILSSSECLSILKSMGTNGRLEQLEVVYQADSAEEDLLLHIATAHPSLWSIELHRYRSEDDDSPVPYEQIALRLASVKRLRRLRLNLDFPETTGPLCDSSEAFYRWTTLFLQVGTRMMAVLHQSCPMLVALEMLKQTYNSALWARFHPSGKTSLYEGGLERDGEWPPFTPPSI